MTYELDPIPMEYVTAEERAAVAARIEELRAAMQAEKAEAMAKLACTNDWHSAVLEALVLVDAGVLPATSVVHALRHAAKLPMPIEPSFNEFAQLSVRYCRMHIVPEASPPAAGD